MSDVKVTIERVTWLAQVPDSDKLDVATVSGFPVVVRRNTVAINDYVVVFPPEIQLPQFVAQQLGIAGYLRKGTVVKVVRLRGQYSYGMAFPLDTPGFEALKNHVEGFLAANEDPSGVDVSEYFGARRYVVPPKFQVKTGQEASENPLLSRYTDIERFEKFQHLFHSGEQVYVTEKIHGANSRVAVIDGEFIAGSRKTQRKMPETFGDFKEAEADAFKDNLYWFPYSIPGVRRLLEDLGKSYHQVILFGEIFGKGIQGSFDYGRDGLDYRAFDLMLNGEYVNPATLVTLLRQYNIPEAPINYIGDFEPRHFGLYVDAPSTLTDKHIREGVVIRPLNERRDVRHGRVIAKWINPEYLVKKSEDKVVDNQE